MSESPLSRRAFFRRSVIGVSAANLSLMPSYLSSQLADYGPPVWFTFEEIRDRLEDMQRRHSQLMNLEILGRSALGRPLFAVRLTDPTVSDELKEHVLFTALHTGVERIGASTMLYLMGWLMSGRPLAREVLRKQVILCMPVVNPDGYVNGTFQNTEGMDPYTNWSLEGPDQPSKSPEAVAVQKMMDEYQPEVHGDMHGSFLEFGGSIHAETAAAYSNVSLRPYHHEVMRLMNDAALEEGYPADWLEEDAERIYWGPELEKISHQTWRGRPRVYAATYCYSQYHTLTTANENAWERSGFLRYRRLLQLGNEVWAGEYFAGYPTRVIMGHDLHRLTAYGRTAHERRRSRLELWSRTRQLTWGFDWPETEGIILCACATSPAAAETWLGDGTLTDVAGRIQRHPRMNAEPIRRLAHAHPLEDGKRGARLLLEGWGATRNEDDRTSPSLPVRHGLAVRLRIPYSKAQLLDLRLNGYPLQLSETDGFLTWVARGFTFVQINVPPERSRTEDLFVITCEYDPREKRSQGKQSFELR